MIVTTLILLLQWYFHLSIAIADNLLTVDSFDSFYPCRFWGWLGEAKMCILRHRGVQLILAYSWARPAVLAAGKGRGGMFLFLLFLHFHSFSFLPCPFLSSPLLSLLSLFSLSMGDDTKWPTRVDMSLNPSLASVAQLDAPSDWRPGGRGFNPRRDRQHSFVEIDHEKFSPFRWFKKGSCQFLAKECAQYWLTA